MCEKSTENNQMNGKYSPNPTIQLHSDDQEVDIQTLTDSSTQKESEHENLNLPNDNEQNQTESNIEININSEKISQRIKKRQYIRFTENQMKVLTNLYQKSNYPERKQIEQVASDFGESITKIDNWFKHKRRIQSQKGLLLYCKKKMFTKQEGKLLNEYFLICQKPSNLVYKELAVKLNCNVKNIKNWFAYKRKKILDNKIQKNQKFSDLDETINQNVQDSNNCQKNPQLFQQIQQNQPNFYSFQVLPSIPNLNFLVQQNNIQNYIQNQYCMQQFQNNNNNNLMRFLVKNHQNMNYFTHLNHCNCHNYQNLMQNTMINSNSPQQIKKETNDCKENCHNFIKKEPEEVQVGNEYNIKIEDYEHLKQQNNHNKYIPLTPNEQFYHYTAKSSIKYQKNPQIFQNQ